MNWKATGNKGMNTEDTLGVTQESATGDADKPNKSEGKTQT